MIKGYLKRLLQRRGYVHVSSDQRTSDMEEHFLDLYRQCKDFTLTSIERMYILYKAVMYLSQQRIPGDLVECGVWKGGSVMLMAKTLASVGDTSRKIHLYDTYEGMTEPTSRDINVANVTATEKWLASSTGNGGSSWCYSALEDVQENMRTTGYPEENLHFVKGRVEDTLPAAAFPDAIALLRLDTDLYESTYCELLHLYPQVARGGVLIVDDYGHWKGSKEATDRYVTENKLPIFLNRVDYAGRVAIKL